MPVLSASTGCQSALPAVQPDQALTLKTEKVAAIKTPVKTPRKKKSPQADTLELVANEDINAEFSLLVKRMRLWQEFLAAAYGVKLKIDYMLPLHHQPEKIVIGDDPDTIIQKNEVNAAASLENDKNPEIFLTKYMTDIFAVQNNTSHSLDHTNTSPEDIIKSKSGLKCAYQNLILSYEHEKRAFKISCLRGDLATQEAKNDEVYTNKVLFENIKAALILAQSAKAAGWTSVNFGNTTDPAKRYALQIACEYVGVDCSSEKIDFKAMPHTCHGDKLPVMIKYSLQEFLPSMYHQIWPDNDQTEKSRDDIDFDDLEAARTGTVKTSSPQPSV